MFANALLVDRAGTTRALTAAQKKNPKTALTAARKLGGYAWLNLIEPDDATMRELAALVHLHPLAAADAAQGKQQPKVQRYDEHLFVVMWNLLTTKRARAGDEIFLGETYLFIGDGLLLTVQRGGGRHAPDDLEALLTHDDAGPAGNVMSGAYRIMAGIVRGYTRISATIKEELEKLEDQVFDGRVDEDSHRIYRLRQRIGKVDRAVSSLASALKASQDHFDELVLDHQDVKPYLRDLLDDLVGTATLTADQNIALGGVLSSHENNVAARQNSDTRKISAFAALLAIPTVTAGLYGMNFQDLPFIGVPYAWAVAAGVIVLIDVWVFVAFKRRHWL